MERTENSTFISMNESLAEHEQKPEESGRRPIIAVDFDGTLCVSKWPEIGAPRFGVIAYCIAARATGSRLILWTNRNGKELEAAVEWCRGHHLEFDAVNENLQECIDAFGGDCRKVFADMYLDDKYLPLGVVDAAGMQLIKKQAAKREARQR